MKFRKNLFLICAIFISFNTAGFGQKPQISETPAINFSVPPPTGKYGVGSRATILRNQD
jgi:hypothetical protein